MGYKEQVAARLYRAFDERRSDASRRRQSFGQKELALGIAKEMRGKPPSQSVVSRWMAEEDPSLPENPVLYAAAKVLGVEVLWLLFEEGPMRRMSAEDMQQRTTVVEPTVTKSPSDIVKKKRGA